MRDEQSTNKLKDSAESRPGRLVEGVDYYWEEGLMVFTSAYHLKRGYCCESGCRHCPYSGEKDEQ